MKTITFYNIEITREGSKMFKLHHYEDVGGYSVNFNNYPAGSFYILNEADKDPELYTMFDTNIKIGPNRYLITRARTGKKHIIDIIGGEAELRCVHQPTMDLVYGILNSLVFDDINLDELEKVIRRRGSEGVAHFFEMETTKKLDYISEVLDLKALETTNE